jgi:predicted CXXCH cytochrome family protein
MRLVVLCQLLAMFSLIALSTGCDRQTQYKILTTVFTGVPPIDELYAERVPEENQNLSLAEEIKKPLYEHPLWAAKQCKACHEIVADSEMDVKFVEGVNAGKSESGTADAMMTSSLILPSEKLCIKCHLDKTSRRAIRDRLWLHNPVARGDCLVCHADHQSANLAHLRQPPAEICLSCHQNNQLPGECSVGLVDVQSKRGCLSCHNTHMGRNRFLLSRDFTEVKKPVGPIADPIPPQDAPRFSE